MDDTEALVEKAISLWTAYAKKYSANLDDYRRLLLRKKELKIRKRPLPQHVLDDYPDISFLKIDTREGALEYSSELSAQELNRLIERIENLRYNYAYNTVVGWTRDIKYLVSHHKSHGYGVSPSSIGGPSRGRSHCIDTKK